MTISIRALPMAALLTLAACGAGEPTPEVFTWGADGPPPTEVFDWGDCPVELAPPPMEWRRQRLQTSLEGVSFRIGRVPPGVIDVGFYRSLHRAHSVRSAASGDARHFDAAPADFTLFDVVDRVRFDPETLPNPAGVVVEPEVERTVGGVPALAVDYTWNDRGHDLQCREVYFAAGECLFVARVRGDASDLELFEHVLASVRFTSLAPASP